MGFSQRLLQGQRSRNRKSSGRFAGQRGQFGATAFKIEGMDGVIDEIRRLPDKIKRREVVKILRRQMKPIERAVKANTPIAERSSTLRGTTYDPGNLKKSIRIFAGRRGNPSVFVGPAMGAKKRNDGFYGFFVQYGTTNQEANDFIAEAALPLLVKVNNEMSVDLAKYLDRKAKQLKLL